MQLGYTALIRATNWGHTDTVEYLVEETDAQVNATTNTVSHTVRSFDCQRCFLSLSSL